MDALVSCCRRLCAPPDEADRIEPLPLHTERPGTRTAFSLPREKRDAHVSRPIPEGGFYANIVVHHTLAAVWRRYRYA